MLEQVGLVEKLVVGLAFLAGGSTRSEQAASGVASLHHAGGLGGALQHDFGGLVGQVGFAQACHCLSLGAHVLGGDAGLGG